MVNSVELCMIKTPLRAPPGSALVRKGKAPEAPTALIGESNVRHGFCTWSERATQPTMTDEAGADPPRRQPCVLSTDQSRPSKPT